MGFFSVLMNGFSKAVADNLWPVFQQTRRMDEHTLRAYIENETVSMRKAVYLLAMNNINPYYSKEVSIETIYNYIAWLKETFTICRCNCYDI